MSLSDLAQELKRQAAQSGQIVLDEETIRQSNLNPSPNLDQLIRDALDLAADGKLAVTLAAADIPVPASADTTLTVTGQSSFLNVNDMTVSVAFAVQGNDLNFTLLSNLQSWEFSASFPAFAGFPFDELAFSSPVFVFSTSAVDQWTWNQNTISIQAGLNFASLVELRDALAPVTRLLAKYSSTTSTDDHFVLAGPIDVQEGKRRDSHYPDLNLQAHISDDTFPISFLNVGKPLVALSIVQVQDGTTTDYHPSLFFGLELTLENDVALEVRAEVVKDAPLVVLSVTAEDPDRPLTLEDAVKLMAGQSFDGFVPAELKAGLAAIAFKGFAASLSLGQQIAITSVQTTLGSTAGWHVFDDLQVDRFDFTWSIIDPGRSNTMTGFFTTQFEFFPDVFQGAFDVEITTDLAITGRFNGSVNFNDLVTKVSDGKLNIPDGFASLSFSDFYLFLDARQQSYSLEATADLGLNLIGDEGIALNHTRFGINAITPPGGGPKQYTGFIMGLLKISDFEIYVSATHPAPGQGWILEGHTPYSDSGISLSELAADFLSPFGVSLPPSVPDVRLVGLAIRYDTQSKAFAFSCAGTAALDGQDLAITIAIDVKPQNQPAPGGQSSYDAQFGGHITFGNLNFDLEISKTGTSATFLATYNNRKGDALNLQYLIGTVSSDVAALIPPSLEITLKDVLFVFSKDTTGSKFLFGLDLGTALSLSDLPLVGQAFPPEQKIGVNDLQVLVASKPFTIEEVGNLNALIPPGVTPLPDLTQTAASGQGQPATPPVPQTTALERGLNLAAKLNLGGAPQTLALPATSSTTPGAPASQATPPPSQPGVTASDSAKWFDLQKSFGPVHFNRVGFQYQNQAVWFLLDAALSAAGLTLSLDGLGFGSPIDHFAPKFDLQGLGVDYKSGPLEIGGAFLRVRRTDADGKPYDEYDGAAIIRTEALGLSAVGSYASLNGQPSLFIYAVLDYPIGGPAFFFITGLAAGFGYNRQLRVPTIDQVKSFPLVDEAVNQTGDMSNLTGELDKLHTYIPPAVGDYFLALGIKFTSFKLIDSFALVTVIFGERFELDILGLSTLIAPTPEVGQSVTPLAEVQMALKASFIPAEGFLGVQAQLTTASYILSRDCHLTGGFAFYAWFSGEHAGDFVQTLGGYHPSYKPPSHYPSVPRLGFNWRVNSELTIKGGAYYALTPSALMAGGQLQATWQSGSLSAYFDAGADFLIAWKPYHYDVSVYVNMGVKYTYHFFGTHHISVDVGADLRIWGPDFSGKAKVHLWIVSFTVRFGAGAAQSPQPIFWSQFKASFLPQDEGQETICGVLLQDGLLQAPDDGPVDWVVNPKGFKLVTNSVIPAKSHDVGGGDLSETNYETTFGIGPMGVSSAAFKSSEHKVTITLQENGQDVSGQFNFKPVHKNVPTGMWGQSLSPSLNGQALIKDTLAGFEITPKEPVLPPPPEGTAAVDRDKFKYTVDPLADVYAWEAFKPFEPAAEQGTAAINQALGATAQARTELLAALGVSAPVTVDDRTADAFLVAPTVGQIAA